MALEGSTGGERWGKGGVRPSGAIPTCRRQATATKFRLVDNAAAGQTALGREAVRSRPVPHGNHRHAHADGTSRRSSSSCFGLVPEVGISRHECTQKQILCRVQSCLCALYSLLLTPYRSPGAARQPPPAAPALRRDPTNHPTDFESVGQQPSKNCADTVTLAHGHL